MSEVTVVYHIEHHRKFAGFADGYWEQDLVASDLDSPDHAREALSDVRKKFPKSKWRAVRVQKEVLDW